MALRGKSLAVALFVSALLPLLALDGCSAKSSELASRGYGGFGGGTTGGQGTAGAVSSSTEPSATFQGLGGAGGVATSIGPDAATNPCGTACGPVELCDEAHLGLDDNCNGLVDEGCSCSAGQTHFCFKGDPSYRNTPGCFDGTEYCGEVGTFSDCIGGVHAIAPDTCFARDSSSCHAITAPPFAEVHLEPGTGTFSHDAQPGTESFTVECPSGTSQCPTVTGLDTYKPLQSGEYRVTYTKHTADGSSAECTFSLFVGAQGLRVELSWEHSTKDRGVDLDLHLHQPNNQLPWSVGGANAQDCGWSNCVLTSFIPQEISGSPHWFSDPPAASPTPVNWSLSTTNPGLNTCYSAPRGVGAKWALAGKGCHNPRLDVDNISCSYAITDPNDPDFCTPENINVDYPPVDQWFRVGVHYFSNAGNNYDVHPEVKIFCDGALSADLGPRGYYVPETRVVFASSGGGQRHWLVADVAFHNDPCGTTTCIVKPLYSDDELKTPLFTTAAIATTNFGPPYPAQK